MPKVDDYEHPPDIRALSRERLDRAYQRIEAFLRDRDAPDEILEELRIVRLIVDPGVRQKSWYGLSIDPDDTSTTVGVMMRNAFEALGVNSDLLSINSREPVKSRSWFVKHYLPLWRNGRQAYYAFMDELLGRTSGKPIDRTQ